MIALALATLIYGIFVLVQVILRKDVTLVLQIIILGCGFFGMITIIIFYVVDPFHSRQILSFQVNNFLLVNSLPLTIINAIIIALIWMVVLKKDLNISLREWTRVLLIVVAIITLITYPSMIIGVLYIGDSNQTTYVITSIFFSVMLVLIIIYYSIYMIRIMIQIRSIKTTDYDKVNIDKILVIFLFILMFAANMCITTSATAYYFIIGVFLSNFGAIANNFLFFYFLRNRTLTKTSKSVSKSNSKKSTPK